MCRRIIDVAAERRRLEEEAIEMEILRKQEEEEREREEYERQQREEEERLEQERLRREEEERLEQERLQRDEEERLEQERIREEQFEKLELQRIEREEEKERKEQEDNRRRQESQRRMFEKEMARLAVAEEAERIRMEEIKALQSKKYSEAYSKDVPVAVRNLGIGRIIDYDGQSDQYRVRLGKANGNRVITVPFDDVKLDEDRILSPRTQVDTPFGVGEVIGMDPHVGCYAINTEINAAEGSQIVAFVQVQDVAVYAEEVEERAIVNEDLPRKHLASVY